MFMFVIDVPVLEMLTKIFWAIVALGSFLVIAQVINWRYK